MAEKIVFAGVIITVIAAFLPWVTVSAGGESEAVSGFDGGDGIITIIAAVVAAGVVYWRSLDIGAMVVTGLLGLVIVGLGLLYINDPGYGAEALFASPTFEAEIGLYFTVIGGATMLAGVGKQALELQ